MDILAFYDLLFAYIPRNDIQKSQVNGIEIDSNKSLNQQTIWTIKYWRTTGLTLNKENFHF